MSEKANRKTPQFDPQIINQLMINRKTPGDIEDLLKDLRKTVITHGVLKVHAILLTNYDESF